jgi:hypothetical protein
MITGFGESCPQSLLLVLAVVAGGEIAGRGRRGVRFALGSGDKPRGEERRGGKRREDAATEAGRQ